jgi:phage gp16-like protein
MTALRPRRFVPAALALTLLLLMLVRSHAAQLAPSNDAAAEIRSLKAALVERLDANLRAQLLVARLGIQEERTAIVSGQLDDVAEQLRENARAKAQVQSQLARLGVESWDPKAKSSFLAAPLQKSLEQLDQTAAPLQQRQAALMKMAADEQSRWTALYTQLEALERKFAPPAR